VKINQHTTRLKTEKRVFLQYIYYFSLKAEGAVDKPTLGVGCKTIVVARYTFSVARTLDPISPGSGRVLKEAESKAESTEKQA